MSGIDLRPPGSHARPVLGRAARLDGARRRRYVSSATSTARTTAWCAECSRPTASRPARRSCCRAPRRRARSSDVPVRLHCCQSVYEFETVLRLRDATPLGWLERSGLLTPRAILPHGIYPERPSEGAGHRRRRLATARRIRRQHRRIARRCSRAAARRWIRSGATAQPASIWASAPIPGRRISCTTCSSACISRA